MAPLYVHKDLQGWALEALRAAGYEVRRVHRVYQPTDATDDAAAEVLYEEDGRVYTALIEPSGHVIATCSGWH